MSADLARIERDLPEAVDAARSLEEIGGWLRSQPGVRSVELSDYLLKSHPPQRDFVVELDGEAGTRLRKVVNVVDLGDGRFEFRTLRNR